MTTAASLKQPTAWLNLRHSVAERSAAVIAGLERLGYEVRTAVTMTPAAGDVLVTWNRIGIGQQAAHAFESRSLPVIVMENAAWGNGFNGGQWLTLALERHNTTGKFPVGGNERWAAVGVALAPWRNEGETVILPQRGIGPPGVAMPYDWANRARARYGGRIRAHPGRAETTPLATDLAKCGRVVTWGSGAAIKALMMGIPVISDMPNWIGEQDNTDAGRLEMFRRLAWAQWTLDEISTGEPFARLLTAQ